MTISKFLELTDDNTLLRIHNIIDGYWYKPLGSKLDKADRANIDTFILCSLGVGATISTLLNRLPDELNKA